MKGYSPYVVQRRSVGRLSARRAGSAGEYLPLEALKIASGGSLPSVWCDFSQVMVGRAHPTNRGGLAPPYICKTSFRWCWVVVGGRGFIH